MERIEINVGEWAEIDGDTATVFDAAEGGELVRPTLTHGGLGARLAEQAAALTAQRAAVASAETARVRLDDALARLREFVQLPADQQEAAYPAVRIKVTVAGYAYNGVPAEHRDDQMRATYEAMTGYVQQITEAQTAQLRAALAQVLGGA